MTYSRKYIKLPTLSSLIVLGWLGQAQAIELDDLPGYDSANAAQANPGAVILMDTYKSGGLYDQERADDMGSLLRDHKAELNEMWVDFILGTIKNPDFPGTSWLYGIAPDTDWRAAFNSSQAMQEAFKAVIPDPDQLDPLELEAIKAVFAQEWIIASQYQTAPLEGDFTGHKTHLHDLAKNIHRLLPKKKAEEASPEDNSKIYDFMVNSIPHSKYVEFIDAVEGQFKGDMNATQRKNYMAIVKLLSEEDRNYEKAAKSLAAVPKDTLKTIHAILKGLEPKDRDSYLAAITPLFTEKEYLYESIAKTFSTSVAPQDYQKVSDAMLRLKRHVDFSLTGKENLIKTLSRLAETEDLDSFVTHLEPMLPPKARGLMNLEATIKTLQQIQPAEKRQHLMNTVEPLIQDMEQPYTRRTFVEDYSKINVDDYQAVADFINDYKDSAISAPSILKGLTSVISRGENLREFLTLLREIFPPKESDFHYQATQTYNTYVDALAHIDSTERASFVGLIKSLFDDLPTLHQRWLFHNFQNVTPQNFAPVAQAALDIEKQTGMNRVDIVKALGEYLDDARLLQRLKDIDFSGLDSLDFENFLKLFAKLPEDQHDNYIDQVNGTYAEMGGAGNKIPLSWAFLRIAPDEYEEFRQNVKDMKGSLLAKADFGLTDYADYLSRVPMDQQKEFNTLVKDLGSELKYPYTKETMNSLAGNPERGGVGIPPSQYGNVIPTLKKAPELSRYESNLRNLRGILINVAPENQDDFLEMLRELKEHKFDTQPFLEHGIEGLVKIPPKRYNEVKPMLGPLVSHFGALKAVAVALAEVEDSQRYFDAIKVLLEDSEFEPRAIGNLLEPLKKVGPENYLEFIELAKENLGSWNKSYAIGEDKDLSPDNFREKIKAIGEK